MIRSVGSACFRHIHLKVMEYFIHKARMSSKNAIIFHGICYGVVSRNPVSTIYIDNYKQINVIYKHEDIDYHQLLWYTNVHNFRSLPFYNLFSVVHHSSTCCP